MSDYQTFLASKRHSATPSGLEMAPESTSPVLFPFQRDLVRWALRKGRTAIFADTGLGKTLMQVEWARHVAEHTGGSVLILAPLAVARQTVRDAADKLSVEVVYARRQADAGPLTITNYEMLEHFDPSAFTGVVLDESSILKSFTGKTRQRLVDAFRNTAYRLCCTATPAPNDITEIANHAEFVGVMSRVEMLATWFVHDDQGWRLKGHAREPFYRWLASWSMSIRLPSDLGYPDDGYALPPLDIQPVIVPVDYRPPDQLFFTTLKGVADRARVRRETLQARVQAAADLIHTEPDEPWIAWVGLNDEGRELARRVPGAVLVEGQQSPEEKAAALESFVDGTTRVLITKPSIAGFGLNLQRCARMAFVGLSDSYEQYYQAIRRCWRFGQDRPVNAYIVLSEPEEAIYANVLDKERNAQDMAADLIRHIAAYERAEIASMENHDFTYETRDERGRDWHLMLGDSAERLKEIPDHSIDLSVFSPPFQSLYVYSPTERDLGNSRTPDEFWEHFGFISRELLRAMKPGRNVCVHVAQVSSLKATDGVIGLKDFRGETIQHFVDAGFVYHGEVCIDKDPQAQAIRTKAKALLFTQLRRDAVWLRPALADYILVFRAPGENGTPIYPDITNEQWIEWARPIWYGIRETDTLNVVEARSNDDERHIAPLQLGTIERCVRLWSNPGETVLSPFAGIGSEGYQALKLGRRFIGVELKPEYFAVATRNLRRAEQSAEQPDLFTTAGIEVA